MIYADIFDASGNRLGDGPVVNIISASATCALDAAGDWNMSCRANDKRALDLLHSERRVNVYVENAGETRRVILGIIR